MKINEKEIYIPENGLSTSAVADLLHCDNRVVRLFASKNNVPYDGEGYRKNYHFFEKDIIEFINRPKPGRRWHKEEVTK
jgi:hypothetical protein